METKPSMTLGKAASAWLRRREVGGIAAPADLSKVRILPLSRAQRAARQRRLRNARSIKSPPVYYSDLYQKIP